ncbi:MAG: diguanylate cyclase [Candidatus Sulfotelmatobacter sp.]|jgi:diguanylate cyclase (GGDEF)-like protein/PAS domain S-box-containing protein
MPAFQDPEIYRDILDGLPIGVSVLDLAKKIVFWSDGAQQITGYARIDVLGHSCRENVFLHCNELSCETCAEKCSIATALHDAKTVETLGLIHHKAGHRTPVRICAIPLRDRHGSIIGIIQTFEEHFALAGPDANNQSMKEHGWLDEVTGLPNQAVMQSHLRETLGTFTEVHIPFGIAYLQVNDLGRFRSSYGQGAARSILQVLAKTLRNTVWPTDFVGSWSDGRFLVILMGCSEEAVHAIGGRILKMMSSASIHWWGEDLSVTVSIGSTGARAGDSVESLLQRAQRAISDQEVAQSVRAAGAGDSRS